MVNKEKEENVVNKISKLRKLGFSPIASILVLVLSTPGVYGLFFNRDAENARIEAIKAQATANTAYEILKAKTENLQDQIVYLRTDVKELTTFLHEILIQRAAIQPPHRNGMGSSPVAYTEPVPEIPEVTAVKRAEELPENLDKLVKTKLMEELSIEELAK
jgi:hypothetical protein